MEQNSWNPWSSKTPKIMDHYTAAQFLRSINKKYIKIRIKALERSEKYSPEYLKSKNQRHINQLKLIIDQYGWPNEELFGKKCMEGAWQIAQHSHDLKFQEFCLQMLSNVQSIPGKQHYAYLSDLLAVKQGKPQYFGTQIDTKGKLYPIQGYATDPTNLAETELQLEVINQRRNSIGFLSLQDEQAKLFQFIMMQQLFTESHEPHSAESAQ